MAEHIMVYGDFHGANKILNKAKEMLVETNGDRKHGSNSSCVIVEHNNSKYAVLKTSNMTIYCNNEDTAIPVDTHKMLIDGNLEFSNVVKLTQKHKCHNAVPIVGYTYDDENFTQFRNSAYANGYIIQECAKGEELYDKVPKTYIVNEDGLKVVIEYTKKYANAPYEQFLSFVNNYREIDKELKIDPSKRNNFFYDEAVGFSFIDLNFANSKQNENNPYIVRGIISQFRPFFLEKNCTSASRKEYLNMQIKLLKKLKTALLEANFNKEIVEQEVAGQYNSIINACNTDNQDLTKQ